MAMLEINNLHFSYKPQEEILKGISLTIDEKTTAIIGQNGAGKTTFVKLLKGLLTPTEGKILLNGRNIKELTVAKLAAHIGMVFQNPDDQIFKNKVIEEACFGPLQIGMDREEAESRASEALSLVGLKGKENANPYDLGLSSRKLLAIASIIAMNTEVVILDEPTIAQDHAGREIIKGAIEKLKNQGKTVITIIHDMDFVADIFERTIVFSEGKLLLEGSTREVFSHKEILEKAHLEQPHVTKLSHALGFSETFLRAEELVAYLKNR